MDPKGQNNKLTLNDKKIVQTTK